LIAQGVARDQFVWCPTAVDAHVPERRARRSGGSRSGSPIGRMTQSKGLLDLFDAARLLQSRIVEVQLFAHSNAGQELCRPYGDLRLRMRTSSGCPGRALAAALRTATCWSCPRSPGFGHVVLEGHVVRPAGDRDDQHLRSRC
jgi:hypothetical protein